MERYVIVIPADEEQKARLVRCDDGDTCKLETLQTLVGGGPLRPPKAALQRTGRGRMWTASS